MIYLLSVSGIIIFVTALKVLLEPNPDQNKTLDTVNLKKLNNDILSIYKRKASVSELKNILLVIKKYKEQYKKYPHENDLQRIIIKYKEY